MSPYFYGFTFKKLFYNSIIDTEIKVLIDVKYEL